MEEALVEQAQRGDEMAFESLIVGMGDRLYTTAYYVLRDTSAAEDATQQALVDMWRHLPRLREPGRFRAWAYRILVRAAYAESRRRRRGGHTLVLLTDAREPADATDTSAAVVLHDQLERAFQRLSPRQRVVVALKHYVGLSDREIADLMELPEGTVRSRRYRALQSLRAAIEADDRPGTMEGAS